MNKTKLNFAFLCMLAMIAVSVCLTSCKKDSISANLVDANTKSTEIKATTNFETLILENISEEKGETVINLSPEEFEKALNLTFNTNNPNATQTYFENIDYRTIFRQNLQEVLIENQLIESQVASKGNCNIYHAEAYAWPSGYAHFYSNSGAYAWSKGTSNLWAVAYCDNGYNEVYAQLNNCPTSKCTARAYYYKSGSKNAYITNY